MQAPGPDWGWVAVGVGPGSPQATAFAATVNVGHERFAQVGAHWTTASDLFNAGAGRSAVHVGGGLTRVDRWSRLAVAAGPAWVWDRDAELAGRSGVGAVVSGQATFTPVLDPGIGLGLDAYAFASRVGVGYGVAVTLVFERNR